MTPYGQRFSREIRTHQQQVSALTINERQEINWAIRQNLDGILTDNVSEALEMSRSHKQEEEYSWLMKDLLEIIRLNFWFYLFGVVLRKRYGPCLYPPIELDKDK